MNKFAKSSILAAALAVASQAGAATYNGDLIFGVTGGGSSVDMTYDLGSAASSLYAPQTWDLSSFTSGFTLSSSSWGVVGTKSGISYSTVQTGLNPGTIQNLASYNNINTANKSIYSTFTTAGAGNSATLDKTLDNSWNQQTINGSLGTQYINVYENPNVTGTGTTADIFGVADNGTDPVDLGTFSLSNGGMLNFTPAPEPSSVSLFAGLGALTFWLRRSVFRKA